MNEPTVAVLILIAVFVAFVLAAEGYHTLHRRPPNGRFWKRKKI
jgi:hypothetical protein